MLTTLVMRSPLTVVVHLLLVEHHRGDRTVLEELLGQGNATATDHQGIRRLSHLGITDLRAQGQRLTVHRHIHHQRVALHTGLHLFLAHDRLLTDTVVLNLGTYLMALLLPVAKGIHTLQRVRKILDDGQFTGCRHRGLRQSSPRILLTIDERDVGALLCSHRIQEVDHLLQVLLRIHTHAVTTLRHEGSLGLHTGSLQRLEELLTLTAGHHIVLLAVEDDHWRVVLIHIGRGTQTQVLIRLLGQLRVEQHVLRTVLTHLHRLAAIHIRQVDRARPVAGGIHGTALVQIVTHVALQVDVHRTHLGLLRTTGGGSRRGEVTT